MDRKKWLNNLDGNEIAIIGMSGRFPGAQNVEEFWYNLHQGIESIKFYSDEQLREFGLDEEMIKNPNFVNAVSMPANIDCFDANFFGMSIREAEITDPQHRLFLECCWESLENASYAPSSFPGSIGVFAGSSISTYLLNNLLHNREVLKSCNPVQLEIANSPDSLTTRASYKLNLRGPSHCIQSACSTSLVAVHSACQSLLANESDIALAGGVSINLQNLHGYWYEEGGIMSPDGHCRTFDSKAKGTVFGNGVGIVVLRRLEDAIRDHDNILAIIRGTAVNNDGSSKVGFTAPSVNGQAAVIAEALSNAGVLPDTIQYVEAHGTGTELGDPIEIQALIKAFQLSGFTNGKCAIGSVKTNIGHLAHASGISGLIKTVLSIQHKKLLPNLHFEGANSEIEFDQSPFYVNTKLSEWKSCEQIRRAGVSSFGFGGTNAHVIVEEPPRLIEKNPSRPYQLLLLSAKTDKALTKMKKSLTFIEKNQSENELSDICYSLIVGREDFPVRSMTLYRQDKDLKIPIIEKNHVSRIGDHKKGLYFVFGKMEWAQVLDFIEIYDNEITFREHVDYCYEFLRSKFSLPVCNYFFERNRGEYSEIDLFIAGYALLKQLLSWGIKPDGLLIDPFADRVSLSLACYIGEACTVEEILEFLLLNSEDKEAGLKSAVKRMIKKMKLPIYYLPEMYYKKTEDKYTSFILDIPIGNLSSNEINNILKFEFKSGLSSEYINYEKDPSVLFSLVTNEPLLMSLINSIGRLWMEGHDVHWQAFYSHEKRKRVALPTYPFERNRYWIDPDSLERNNSIDKVEDEQPLVQWSWEKTKNMLLKIWESQLGVVNIGLDDNFFELGGDSFIAIQVTKKIRESFNIQLNVAELYERLTVRLVTDYVYSRLKNDLSFEEPLEDEERVFLKRKKLQQLQRSRRENRRGYNAD
ncbi:type I polyketide synthase [Bacillus wiedmannii]|uniref:type I polyketide synthase n=1 Tax=Bacillus wiedmannii TaxID=1890302 RepID=UPI000BF1D7C7|nr:beta-ketoacyl synthase N-terminal-like domain-containing protein [Bacillus wiedmannii]PEL52429.1 polyketide synthase [Bacillus wiedmannii]PEO06294.1 polyketide synthase [Bacillus wiedmannii]PEQ00753.1 polyketide synthase [Bacillus wiedmannii]